MTRMAILKPDHLGDLVLASPAIRAICRQHCDVTLFVGSGSHGLARYLFGETLEIRDVDFPHLSRRPVEAFEQTRFVHELNEFSIVVCLRDDPVMREMLAEVTAPHRVVFGSNAVHETISHRNAVAELVGAYSRTELFSGTPIPWPARPTRIALCVAAGFPTNRWPNVHWLELADHLIRAGLAIVLVGGPGEANDLKMLSRLLARFPHRVVQGGSDFAAFLASLDDVDLVVASDGGTAQICSLRKPICSIFGSSPWRRYAPFGRGNVLLTRDEVCSPCVQFSAEWVNGCLTRECMSALSARQVAGIVQSDGADFSHVRGLRVERGVSHRRFA
jgi:ADP-heptose:LPS heptosyltransferase